MTSAAGFCFSAATLASRPANRSRLPVTSREAPEPTPCSSAKARARSISAGWKRKAEIVVAGEIDVSLASDADGPCVARLDLDEPAPQVRRARARRDRLRSFFRFAGMILYYLRRAEFASISQVA